MRTGPIDFAANRATTEILVINFRERLELIENIGFVRAFEQTVALQAPCIRRDQFPQVEPTQNFDDLLIAIV